MRWFEAFLRVEEWNSDCPSLQRLLDRLARKTRSEPSRRRYLGADAARSREGKGPEEALLLLHRIQA
ncbi:MAG: hypothetical protein LYZ70_03855 [Nitrososphaerales archaeon]|nr:hypothetical protein [Nitrososphaerales archaeon]